MPVWGISEDLVFILLYPPPPPVTQNYSPFDMSEACFTCINTVCNTFIYIYIVLSIFNIYTYFVLKCATKILKISSQIKYIMILNKDFYLWKLKAREVSIFTENLKYLHVLP